MNRLYRLAPVLILLASILSMRPIARMAQAEDGPALMTHLGVLVPARAPDWKRSLSDAPRTTP